MPDKTHPAPQPEALRSLEAAAEHGSKKPDDQGLKATPQTAPRPASLKQEQDTATEILRARTDGDAHRMSDAAKKAPKR